MENQNQVEKFDPSTLMEGVKNRIKATFVSLIPDDQWEQMCNAEMKKFFDPIPVYGYNKNIERYNPSEFETMVKGLMKDKCKEYLEELIKKPEYSMQQIWESSPHSVNATGQKIILSDHLDNMIKEKMPEMMQAMFSSVMGDAFYNFFGQIRNRLQQPCN